MGGHDPFPHPEPVTAYTGGMADPTVPHEPIRWRAQWTVDKFHGDISGVDVTTPDAPAPYESIEQEGNLLMYGGASALWDLLIGAGNVSAFNNTNAHIGVGDDTTAASATQTDLQASTNKVRAAQTTSFPSHTDGTTSAAASITFKSQFTTGDGNFTWNEWAVFNASSGGRMLNRKVSSLGTKTVADTWNFTVTFTLA